MKLLTDIVSLASICIMRFCPPLFSMLRDDTDYTPWTLQVGTSFGIPAFGVDESSELTFGSLICVACLYVRTLQQINNSKKIAQVTSPREILVARKSRLSQTSSTTTTKLEDTKLKHVEPKISVDNISTVPSDLAIKMSIDDLSLKEKDSQLSFTQIQNLAGKQTTPEVAKGFIRIDYLNPLCNITAVQNFASYASPVKTFPWFAKLNEEKTTRALEAILTMLASQVNLVLYINTIGEREEKLIKRELCSELQTFHDFTKKRVGELYRYSISDRSCLIRKKIGLLDDEEPLITDPRRLSTEGVKSSSNKRGLNVISATALETISKLSKQVEINSSSTKSSFTSEVKTVSNTSEVRLVSEDYLHFLSLWFTHVLHKNNEK